ncbi:PQQ-dependent sugar dehydrogenase [Parvularcula marina]|uniref:PQQ-dependent sugar dehydrogenase n=1 Tax=Parvularcula marina TaxID=2292771 RepID=UPI003515D8FA
MTRPYFLMSAAMIGLAGLPACAGESQPETQQDSGVPFEITEVAEFTQPWALVFLPDGRMLVTEKPGNMRWVTQGGETSDPFAGLPAVDEGGQGGLGDVILHPDFEDNSTIYFSYVEAGEGDTRGAVVATATLSLTENGGALSDVTTIWRQNPKVTGRGHFGHRLAFSPDGDYLFISSGERQKFDPAQDMAQNLGKIIRLYPDGSVPEDNPFYDQGGVTAQIWSFGHRNPLGLAFNEKGELWEHEMGPRHGDEFQLIERGENYGYPIVSNGDHYSGEEIPDHDTRPEFRAPDAYWVPAISPAGLIFYGGEMFESWKGDAFIGGLSSRALVRVTFDCEDGATACEAERYSINDQRVREIEEGPDGTIWVLTESGSDGTLVKLTPAE